MSVDKKMGCDTCSAPPARKVRLAASEENDGKRMSNGVIIGIIVLIFMIVVSVAVGLACSCGPKPRYY
jgi:hypothetical protein